MEGATAARTVEYHRPARRVKAFAASAQADRLLLHPAAYPVGIELADFPRLARLASHAEAHGPLDRIAIRDPRVRALPRDVECLHDRDQPDRQRHRGLLDASPLHAPPDL